MVDKSQTEDYSNIPKESPPKPDGWFGVRHVQYILLLLSVIIAFGIRTAFNVAMLAMISDDPPDGVPTYPEWADMKYTMLSSFFWGYVCFQIGAGQLAKSYGPKLFMGCSIFLCSLFTLLVPIMGAKLGYGGVIACRVIQGLAQGFLFPCTHNLLSAWVPVFDRAKVGSFVYTGGPLGTVIALPITGLISESSVGWPVLFYLYGGLGVLWTLAWMFFGADCPAKHTSISEKERRYIEDGVSTENKEAVPTPWKSIITSLPFWAVLVGHCGNNWGFFTLLTEIPSYMEKILKFKIASNSYLSALPYLVLWLLGFIMSPLADILVVRQIISRTASRKFFNSIGLLVPALGLFALNFVGSTQKEVTIFLLVIAVGFNAGAYSGYNVNHMDISPVHSGTLMGITNTAANICSIIAPLAVDALSSITGYEETDKSLWNVVFSLAAIIYVITGIFFVLFASGEVQSWNNVDTNRNNADGNGQNRHE